MDAGCNGKQPLARIWLAATMDAGCKVFYMRRGDQAPHSPAQASAFAPAQTALAGKWSSLANFGFTSIAGLPVSENFEVLRPHLSDRHWERRDVDVGRYAPECFGVQRRFCSSMGNDAEAMPFQLQGHREHEVRH